MPWRAVVEITSPFVTGTGTNTWHARAIGGAQEGFDTLAETLEQFYLDILGTLAGPVSLAFDGQWQGVGPDQGEVQEAEGWTISNGGATPPLPLAISQVVTWRTALRTRSGRGRTFLGPMSAQTLQDNGTPSESSRTLIGNAAAALIAAQAGTAGEAFGVWSPTDQVIRDFVSSDVPNEYAVLRSRRD